MTWIATCQYPMCGREEETTSTRAARNPYYCLEHLNMTPPEEHKPMEETAVDTSPRSARTHCDLCDHWFWFEYDNPIACPHCVAKDRDDLKARVAELEGEVTKLKCLHSDAANDWQKARAENIRLREALKPFNDFLIKGLKGFTDSWEERYGAEHIIFGWNEANLTLGMLLHARKALTQQPNEGETDETK